MSGEDSTKPLTYRDAGVDIDAGDALVDAIKPLAASTRRPGADGALGGFGGLFDLKAAGFKDPVLVSGTDGVGTKLMLAFATNRHETIGIDLVARLDVHTGVAIGVFHSSSGVVPEATMGEESIPFASCTTAANS